VALGLSLHSLPAMIGALVLFFAALNLLEALLPSLVSKCAPPDARGAAMGINSSIQFLGAFVGAASGGWLAEHAGGPAIFVLGVALTFLWLTASATMTTLPSPYHSNYSMGET
jgi:predicted MFS family arabinose efflux permease